MERLTSRDGKGRAYFDDDGSLIRGANGTFYQKKDMTAQFIHQRFVALDKAIDRLAAYEDTGLTPEEVMGLDQAKQDGRLVVLPCKVGDTVYIYSEGRGIRTEKVRTFFLGHPSYRTEDRKMRMVRAETCDIPFSKLGTNLFLTREEAEAALATQKGDPHETDPV